MKNRIFQRNAQISIFYNRPDRHVLCIDIIDKVSIFFNLFTFHGYEGKRIVCAKYVTWLHPVYCFRVRFVSRIFTGHYQFIYCRTRIFRAHLLFANGQPTFSRACIFREWVKMSEDRRQKIPQKHQKTHENNAQRL